MLNSSSKRKLNTQPIFFTSGLLKPIFPRNIIKIDWHASPFLFQVTWNFLESFQLSDFNVK